MTLEAIALHYLDNLDAKIHTFSREIRDDPSKESSWTPFQQSLGRRLFKGTAPADGATASRGSMPNAADSEARSGSIRLSRVGTAAHCRTIGSLQT